MKHPKASGWGTLLVTTSVVLSLAAPAQAAPASAKSSHSKGSHKATVTKDTREVPPGKTYKLDRSVQERSASRRALAAATGTTPAVGTVRSWIGLDDYNGTLYRKDYTLRGVGDNIEVWVANDIAFPAGDCRSATSGTTEVTDAQVAGLVS